MLLLLPRILGGLKSSQKPKRFSTVPRLRVMTFKLEGPIRFSQIYFHDYRGMIVVAISKPSGLGWAIEADLCH